MGDCVWLNRVLLPSPPDYLYRACFALSFSLTTTTTMNSFPSGGAGSPARPRTPSNQGIPPPSDPFSPLSPTMSPDLVRKQDLENPFGSPEAAPQTPPTTYSSPPVLPVARGDTYQKKRKADSNDECQKKSKMSKATTSAAGNHSDGTLKLEELSDDDIRFISSNPPRLPFSKTLQSAQIAAKIPSPSIEPQTKGALTQNIHYQPDLSGTSCTITLPMNRRKRRSSAPPSPPEGRASEMDLVNRYDGIFNPPPGTPLHIELVSYIRYWQHWLPHVLDQTTKTKLTQCIGEALTKVWLAGIDKGHIPKRVPEGIEELPLQELEKAIDAQHAQEMLAKLKKLTDPAKVVLVNTQRYVRTDYGRSGFSATAKPPNYSITTGEVSEAGIRWSLVQARVARGDLTAAGEDLMQRATNGQPIIPSVHWRGIKPLTPNNPIRRDLKMYCLWEVCRCDAQIVELEILVDNSPQGEAHEAAQSNLDAEKKLRNTLLAIALELDPQTKTIDLVGNDEDEEDDGIEELTTTPQFPTNNHIRERTQGTSSSAVQIAPSQARSITPAQSYLETEIAVIEPDPNRANGKYFFAVYNYIRDQVRPRANKLLGQDVLEDHVAHWRTINKALKDGNVSVGRRNELAVDINQFYSQLDLEEKPDFSEFPSPLEVWQAIPPHGLSFQEFKPAFPEVKNFTKPAWAAIVNSVARLVDGRWMPKPSSEAFLTPELPPIGFREHKVVRLQILAISQFDPEDYSARTVNNTMGFRWRYTNSSTIAQRASMDEVIQDHVVSAIASDRLYIQESGRKNPPRSGRYDVLAHPADLDGPAVVHGLWDVSRGRMTDDPNFQWFFDGIQKENNTYNYGFKSYDPVPEFGSMAESVTARAQTLAGIMQAQQQQAQETPTASKSPAITITTPATKGKDKGKTLTLPITPPSTKKSAKYTSKTSKSSSPTKVGKASSSGGSSSSKKRKIKQEFDDSPRLKRTRGKPAPQYYDDADFEIFSDEDAGDGEDEYDDSPSA